MKRRIGIALDIDGVLLRGKSILPSAIKAMNLLHKYKIPHIFITNGGGQTEHAKAMDLSHKLHHVIREEQVIQAHTPYKRLVSIYKDSNILIIGHDKCMEVMKSYGFKHIYTTHDILSTHSTIYPREINLRSHSLLNSNQTISAAFIVHDPIDWALEIQILTDILIDGHPNINSSFKINQSIPLYACNADLVYTTEYHRPRYTQGAFVEAFKHLFEQFTQSKLQIEYFGKPYLVQYQMAEEFLSQEAQKINQINNYDSIEVYYGIGDNPMSDIRGANHAGKKWKSVLVRTGVFKGKENDDQDKANIVVDTVYDAIQHIIQENS